MMHIHVQQEERSGLLARTSLTKSGIPQDK